MSDAEKDAGRDLRHYLEDLSEIKKLMESNEERGLLETWAFSDGPLLS